MQCNSEGNYTLKPYAWVIYIRVHSYYFMQMKIVLCLHIGSHLCHNNNGLPITSYHEYSWNQLYNPDKIWNIFTHILLFLSNLWYEHLSKVACISHNKRVVINIDSEILFPTDTKKILVKLVFFVLLNYVKTLYEFACFCYFQF